MARVGKAAIERRIRDPHDALREGISEHANQVYGHLALAMQITDPCPRDYVHAGLNLKAKREIHELPELARDVVVGTFLFLVPVSER